MQNKNSHFHEEAHLIFTREAMKNKFDITRNEDSYLIFFNPDTMIFRSKYETTENAIHQDNMSV